MTGTDKQISWATEILDKFLNAANECADGWVAKNNRELADHAERRTRTNDVNSLAMLDKLVANLNAQNAYWEEAKAAIANQVNTWKSKESAEKIIANKDTGCSTAKAMRLVNAKYELLGGKKA